MACCLPCSALAPASSVRSRPCNGQRAVRGKAAKPAVVWSNSLISCVYTERRRRGWGRQAWVEGGSLVQSWLHWISCTQSIGRKYGVVHHVHHLEQWKWATSLHSMLQNWLFLSLISPSVWLTKNRYIWLGCHCHPLHDQGRLLVNVTPGFLVGRRKEGAARLELWSCPRAWSSVDSSSVVTAGYTGSDPQYRSAAMVSLLGPGSTSPVHTRAPWVRVTQWQLHLFPSTLAPLTHEGTVLLMTQEGHVTCPDTGAKHYRTALTLECDHSTKWENSGRYWREGCGRNTEKRWMDRWMDAWMGCCFMPAWQSVHL